MKILKYKKLKSQKYQVFLDNLEILELYEETILKYDLLITKKVDEKILEELLEYNKKYEAYYTCLKYLNVRVRSRKEIKDYLKKKDYNDDVINYVIAILEKQGYLNDLAFAKSFLNNKLITTNNGPYTIRRDLLKHEISISDIDLVLEEYTDDIQLEKIKKHINRIIKSNRNKSNIVLQRKTLIDLNNEGFKKNLIQQEISKIDFADDKDLAKKEYDKLYKKLSRKYSGRELELKIKQKLYQKGFSIEQ